jgi:hypothetical protein
VSLFGGTHAFSPFAPEKFRCCIPKLPLHLFPLVEEQVQGLVGVQPPELVIVPAVCSQSISTGWEPESAGTAKPLAPEFHLVPLT